MKFCFGDIVVVENNLIGVVVKSWCPSITSKKPPYHEVYVRYYNEIREYSEDVMERYMVRHKYLSGEEIRWQDNAVHNNQSEFDEICKNIFEKVAEDFKAEKEIEEREKQRLAKIQKHKEKNIEKGYKKLADTIMRGVDTKQIENFAVEKPRISMLDILYDTKNNTSSNTKTRAVNTLSQIGIFTLDDFLNMDITTLTKRRNVGRKTLIYMLESVIDYCKVNNIVVNKKLLDLCKELKSGNGVYYG